MKCKVLGLGYPPKEHDVQSAKWLGYGMVFHFADSIRQAAEMLREQDYTFIAIRSDQISHEDLLTLREIRSIPTIILPPTYTAAEEQVCTFFSAMQFAPAHGCESNLPFEQREPLTVITMKDLRFCLEYRCVEIRGVEVELTEKEFDILALLLTNPKEVSGTSLMFRSKSFPNIIQKQEYSYPGLIHPLTCIVYDNIIALSLM